MAAPFPGSLLGLCRGQDVTLIPVGRGFGSALPPARGDEASARGMNGEQAEPPDWGGCSFSCLSRVPPTPAHTPTVGTGAGYFHSLAAGTAPKSLALLTLLSGAKQPAQGGFNPPAPLLLLLVFLAGCIDGKGSNPDPSIPPGTRHEPDTPLFPGLICLWSCTPAPNTDVGLVQTQIWYKFCTNTNSGRRLKPPS